MAERTYLAPSFENILEYPLCASSRLPLATNLRFRVCKIVDKPDDITYLIAH
ncbi:uncharacterized protein G2W53_001497 [Senna tora]|uniref:Uncharacterized protein n=1 Tax=Senna tora TaxID=362788 RepID=A0A835CMM3_9FABA|nr:uncharacterized protein G2W53_001497 [Senna tora]